jgi:threonine synthase
MIPWPGVIARYRNQIDLPPEAVGITLLEGNTPLIPMPRLANALGVGDLFIKFEGLNPTGSFKDRGMTVAISEAAHRGAQTAICASTGNTAASAAAYAARAGMRCLVLIPEGQVAVGKLAGAIAYGADVIQINGSFDDALDMVRQAAERYPLAIVNSINPYRLEGQKTVAFEITEALGQPPDWLALPVGNAGNISAAWMGFSELHATHGIDLPKLLGVQAAGAAPLVDGHPIDRPMTIATAIKIGRPARGDQALSAAAESGGRIVAASDDQILDAQRTLANEGIWVEPASAAGIAGLKKEIGASRLDLTHARVVAICTGHGLKDPGIVTDRFPTPTRIDADLEALEPLIQR